MAWKATSAAATSLLVSGLAVAQPVSLNVADLDGVNGFTLNGNGIADDAGRSVSSAGDINGDGMMDLIVGAPFAEQASHGATVGQAYVVFGRTDIADLHLSSFSALDGTNGFAIDGNRKGASQRLGETVAGAGDVNGDGFDDIIVANPNASTAYLIYGSATIGASGSIVAAEVNGNNGFIMSLSQTSLGLSAAGLGDFNDDGLDDFVLGAPRFDINNEPSAGAAFVVYGSASFPLLNGQFDMESLDGTNGFRVEGVHQNGNLGVSVSSAGDLNADGLPDLVVGGSNTARVSNGAPSLGSAYIVMGGAASGGTGVLTRDSFEGEDGFVLLGEATGDGLGRSVSNAGDLNNDGVDDLFISTLLANQDADTRASESYVVFGRAGLSVAEAVASGIGVRQFTDESGFVIEHGADSAVTSPGSEVMGSAAGDFNGDGIDDLVVGFGRANGAAGQAYVIYGGESLNSIGTLEAMSLDGTNGIILDGAMPLDSLGASLAATGDLNGDGIDDFVISSPNADPNGINGAGQVYVVFGQIPEPGTLALVTLAGLVLVRRRRSA
ncbi:FG-GAP-like repeat-containing protein [Phycisphaeraceae bacterium D3-23]